MEKPPMEWIDNLFNCMKEFYGTRWTRRFDRMMPEELAKTVWQSGLQGLAYEEIRYVLLRLKQSAKNPHALPPSHMEFFNYAKGTSQPPREFKEPVTKQCDPEVAKRHLDEINARLRYRKVAEEGAKVDSL